MSLPALCSLIFAISAIGIAVAVRLELWAYLLPFSYFALVTFLVYIQLPYDEQMGEGE